jgi:hypothetical protein
MIWIILLRVIGAVLLLATLADLLFPTQLHGQWFSLYDYSYLLATLERIVLIVLSFGGAAALGSLRRTEQRIARATSSRRRVPPHEQVRNLAPDAPGSSTTERYLDDAERVRYGGRPVRRIDQLYYTFRTEGRRKHNPGRE